MTIKDVSTSDAELTLTGEFLDFTAPGLFAYWTRPDLLGSGGRHRRRLSRTSAARTTTGGRNVATICAASSPRSSRDKSWRLPGAGTTSRQRYQPAQ